MHDVCCTVMNSTVDTLLLEAIEAHKSEQIQKAEQSYRAILELRPDHPDANHNLGVLLMKSSRDIEALSYLRTAVEVFPNHGQFWLSYINALIEGQHLIEAADVLSKAREYGLDTEVCVQLESRLSLMQTQSPSRSEIDELLASHNAGYFEQTESLAKKLVQQYPAHAFGWKALGSVFNHFGRFEEALEALQRSLSLSPNDANAYNSLGNAYDALGRISEAQASYQQAIRLNPEYAISHCNLGNALRNLGDLEAAQASYIESIRLDPKLIEAHRNLGLVFKDLGKLTEAVACYRIVVQLQPDLTLGHLALGHLLKELGQWSEAEAAFRKAVQLEPESAEGHNVLGNLLSEVGRPNEAQECFRQAIRLKPDLAAAYVNLGNTLKDLGCMDEVEGLFREAIRLDPMLVEAHNNLGNTLRELGDLQGATSSYEQAIYLKPDYAQAYSNLGLVFHDLDRLGEAEENFRKAISLSPNLAEAYNNLGSVLHASKHTIEAEGSYREAIRLKPDLTAAHGNLGNLLRDLGRPDEALVSYREALRLNPAYAQGYCNLGLLFHELGLLKDAVVNFHEGIRLQPTLAQAHNNLGNVLKDLGQLIEAEASYRTAIHFDSGIAEAHNNLGLLLNDLGRLNEALTCFRDAIKYKPEYTDAFSNLLLSLNYGDPHSPEEALKQAEDYGALVSAKSRPKYNKWLVDDAPTKFRVGWVSGDLRAHPVGYFVEGLIKHLDKNVFELHAFPTLPKTDALTARIQPYFEKWLPIHGMTDQQAAQVIHNQGIHVLIDLSGHTGHNRLPVFSFRPAPVQVSWLGYFATTGLPEMDYFLGDPVMAPDTEQHHFTERLWRLAQTWLCLTPPTQAVPVAELPALSNGHVTFGCFGNLAKMNDRVVKTWADILNKIPNAKLHLKTRQLADPLVQAEVQGRFARENVAADRLILEGPELSAAYYAAYNRIDIVLDTFPYPGGTTSVDALWMGVPVLTMKGSRFLSHLGESIATQAGQSGWIAQDTDDYVNKALAFAADTKALAELHRSLRDRVLQSPLFDTPRFARHFGDALQGMWQDSIQRIKHYS